jgi:signal transduction histidine kinase
MPTASSAEAEDYSRLAIEMGGMGTWDWDLVHDRVTSSPRLRELAGRPSARGAVTVADVLAVLHPPDREGIRAAVATARAGGAPFRHEFRVVHPDGGVHWLMAHGDFVRDASGTPVRMLGVVKDIDARKVREQQLLHVQQLESVRLLAGGVAHDFNNLLAAILGFAGHARADVPAASDAAHCIGEIEAAATRAGELCRQLLTFAGRHAGDAQALDLGTLVAEIARLLGVVVHATARFEVDVPRDATWVHGDAVQLRQVAMNLIVNASEALDGRAGTVSVHTRRVTVDAPSALSPWAAPDTPPGDYVVLEVRDTGCGIAPDALSRIFDPFYSTKPSGRGLGLATVHGIVDRHGGFLAVDSVPGEGSRFRAYLPALPP